MLIFIPFNFSHSPLWLLRFIVFPSFFPPRQLYICHCSHPQKKLLPPFSPSCPLFLPSFLLFCLLSPTLCLVSDLYPLNCLTPSFLLVLFFTSVSTGTPWLHTLKFLSSASSRSCSQSRLCLALPLCSLLNKTSSRLLTALKHPLLPPQPITLSLLLTAFQDQSRSLSLPYNTNSSLKTSIADVPLNTMFPLDHFSNISLS